MGNHIIAICDRDEKYALSLSTSVEEVMNSAYEVVIFTSGEAFVRYSQEKEVDVLIITESSFDSTIIDGFEGTLMILRENQNFVQDGAILIDRFQSRDNLSKSVKMNVPDYLEEISGKRMKTYHWKVIGIYSPVRRCLQTSFALALGQGLGREKKVLYMNFENFSGFSGWFQREFETDILDLLYFFNCDPEKLKSRIPKTIHKLGNLDVMPPPSAYYDTYERSGEKWIKFFEAIEDATDYEYLILDITDAMQGVLQILEYCDRIYTLIKDDPISKFKVEQYERWMVEHSYSDIIGKSVKFSFPQFSNIPLQPEMLSQCELAEYVRAIIDEDKMGGE